MEREIISKLKENFMAIVDVQRSLDFKIKYYDEFAEKWKDAETIPYAQYDLKHDCRDLPVVVKVPKEDALMALRDMIGRTEKNLRDLKSEAVELMQRLIKEWTLTR